MSDEPKLSEDEIIGRMARALAGAAGEDFDDLLANHAALYRTNANPYAFASPIQNDKAQRANRYYNDAKRLFAAIRAYEAAKTA